MKRLLILLLFFATSLHAQAWSGILPASRAANWGSAGLPTSLNYGTGGAACNGSLTNCTETATNPWTPPVRAKCGSTITSGATFTAINSAIAACSPGTYVLLGAGTFTSSSTALNLTTNGVTLRGSGADQTIIQCSSTCRINFSNGSSNPNPTWTAGFTQGTTAITLNSTNASGMKIGQTLISLRGQGSSTDTGGVWVCATITTCISNGSGTPLQYENHLVVGCDGVTTIGHVCTNSGANPVVISPAINFPAFSLLSAFSTPWINPSIGTGLEDTTVDCTGNTSAPCIGFQDVYASWFKGNRVVNGPPGEQMDMNYAVNTLVSNSYFTQQGQFSETIANHITSGLNLILNNLFNAGGAFIQSGGGYDVYAFNLCRDAYTNSGTRHDVNNTFSNHTPGYANVLFEGNECGNWQEDNVHGTANLNTFFRNMLYGNDPPYVDTNSPFALVLYGPSRMENIIGNVMGNSLSTSYKCTASSCSGTPVAIIGAGNTGPGPSDSLSSTSAMFWGNWDIFTNAVRWCGNSGNTGWSNPAICNSTTEVPQGMTGNAAAYNVTVPATQTLPLSFFMSGLSAGTSGTGLPFGKVCTNFNTATDTCGGTFHFSPMPLIGPDVISGDVGTTLGFPQVNGFANHVPAYYAWKNLPVDTTYRDSFTISNASYSGTTETLTLSTAWPANVTAPSGEFTLTGSGCDGTYMMTFSTTTTVQFSSATNPGCSNSGTLLWPNIRKFNETVYQADPSGSASTPTFSPGAGTYTGTQTVTISTTTPGAILCWNTTGAPATNGLGTACITGTLINSTSGSITVSGNETVYAVAGAASLSDSSVGSASYTITNPTPPAPAVMFAAVPVPAQPPIPVLTLSTPTQSYVTANGFSQDGKTWNKSLTLTLTGTGFTSTTACAFNGTSVPCVCGTATTCTATVPASMVPIPTKTAQYPIALSNPAVPAPILQ